MPLLNVDRARENFSRHRWAKQLINGWQSQCAHILEQDKTYIESLTPDLTLWPEYGQNCPACVNRLSSMGETGLYDWSIQNPDRLTCNYCKTEYPNSDYPETGSMTASRMGQTFEFFLTDAERANPNDTSGVHAFKWTSWPVHTSWSGVIRTKKARWCYEQLSPLASLYALTDDVRCAERASWILDTVASRYPNWLFHSYDGTYADCPPEEAARSMGEFPQAGRFTPETIISAFEGRHQKGDHAVLNNGFWGAGRFGCSGSDGRFILEATVAYDLIREATRADGTPVITQDMDRRIVEDLILAGTDDTENWDAINNKCGPGRALSAAVGILFDRPGSVKRAVEGFEALMDDAFHFDGFCTESPGYSNMHLNLLRDIPELLEGSVNPNGDGTEILHPFRDFSRYRLALESMVRMLDPSLSAPVIGDSREGTTISPIHAEVLAAHYGNDYAGLLELSQGAPVGEKGSEYALWHRDPDLKADGDHNLPLHTEWFPGWHVAVLRGGNASEHTAFYMNGYAYGGHRHFDTLGIIYVSNRVEMAADRGYIWDDPRNAWTKSTLAHNIVTVDGQSQIADGGPAKLELFGRGPGLEIVQASATVYEQCDRYVRTCVLVQVPGAQTYALDIFRVRGGSLHQYGFHSNGSLSDLSAEVEPDSQEISWLSNIRSSGPLDGFTATWQNEGVKLDLSLLNATDRLLLADAPGWRSDLGNELNRPPVQQIMAERSSEGELCSQFASIISPYEDSSPIISSRVLVDDPESETLALEIARADATDIIVSNPAGGTMSAGPLTMTGRFAFVSVDQSGRVTRSYLLDGTHLGSGDTSLTLPSGRTELAVSSTHDRTYHLTDIPPNDLSKPGSYLLVGDTGYEIESVSGSTLTVRDYPATESDTITLLHSIEFSRER